MLVEYREDRWRISYFCGVFIGDRFPKSSAKMSFADFMSVLSVYRIQQPDAIWFHCSSLPDSRDFYWTQLWTFVPLTVVYHDSHKLETGLKSVQDSAVVATLLEHGGIFVDWNILVVCSLDPLRNYSTCFSKVCLLSTLFARFSESNLARDSALLYAKFTVFFVFVVTE